MDALKLFWLLSIGIWYFSCIFVLSAKNSTSSNKLKYALEVGIEEAGLNYGPLIFNPFRMTYFLNRFLFVIHALELKSQQLSTIHRRCDEPIFKDHSKQIYSIVMCTGISDEIEFTSNCLPPLWLNGNVQQFSVQQSEFLGGR